MFRVLSLNGESRSVRLASEPDGVPVVTDDFGCSWHVAEFDVEAPPVVEVASTVVEVVDVAEPTKPAKRERKPKADLPVEPVVE